jgi:hypothetical protein
MREDGTTGMDFQTMWRLAGDAERALETDLRTELPVPERSHELGVGVT